MPEINSILFGHRELLELMIKASNLHEGEWQLTMHFTFTAGNFGPTEDSVLPGAVAAVSQVGLMRARADSPKALSLDAAVVNPLPT